MCNDEAWAGMFITITVIVCITIVIYKAMEIHERRTDTACKKIAEKTNEIINYLNEKGAK